MAKSILEFVENNRSIIEENIKNDKDTPIIYSVFANDFFRYYWRMAKYKLPQDIKNSDNKKRIIDFKEGEILNGKLPNKINFITSAYFTGYDIIDKIRLVIISDSSKENTILSEYEIYQISGRCRNRNNIKEIDILFNTKKINNKIYEVDECLDLAQRSLKVIDCFKYNFNGSCLNLELEIALMKRYSVVNIIDKFSFVKIDNLGKAYIAYLNIDAFIEKQRVSNFVYESPDYLKNFLSKSGYLVKHENHVSKIKLDKKIECTNKKSLKDAIEFILSSGCVRDSAIRNYLSQNQDKISKRVLNFYKIARNKKIEKFKIDIWLKQIKSIRGFNKLMRKYNAYYDKKRSDILLTEFLKVGVVYSEQELRSIIKKIYCDILMMVKEGEFNVKKAKNDLENYVTFKRVQKTVKKKKVDHFMVLNFNPLGI